MTNKTCQVADNRPNKATPEQQLEDKAVPIADGGASTTGGGNDYYDDEPDRTCRYCGGDGGDPWNDGILPCPECEGEGYRWWE